LTSIQAERGAPADADPLLFPERQARFRMPATATTYDLVMLIDPQAEDSTRARIVSDTRSAIEAEGELVRHDEWGERPLTYPIEKKASAEYHLLQFHVSGDELLNGLDHTLRITDGLLRFRIIKLKAGTPDAPDMRAGQVRREAPAEGAAPAAEVAEAPAEGAAPAAEVAEAPAEGAAPAAEVAEAPAEVAAPEAPAEDAAPVEAAPTAEAATVLAEPEAPAEDAAPVEDAVEPAAEAAPETPPAAEEQPAGEDAAPAAE
jgi:small subunit ribosomal protein S6